MCFEKILKQIVDEIETHKNEYYVVRMDGGGFSVNTRFSRLFSKIQYYVSGPFGDIDSTFLYISWILERDIIKLYEDENVSLLKYIEYNPIYGFQKEEYGLEKATVASVDLFMYEDQRFVILQHASIRSMKLIELSSLFVDWSFTLLYDKQYGNTILVMGFADNSTYLSIRKDDNFYPLIWFDDIKSVNMPLLGLWILLNKTMLYKAGYTGELLAKDLAKELLYMYRDCALENGLCFRIRVNTVKKNYMELEFVYPSGKESLEEMKAACFENFDENVSRLLEVIEENDVSVISSGSYGSIRYWLPNDILFRVFNSRIIQDLLIASGLPGNITLESILKPWILHFVRDHKYILILGGTYYYDSETDTFQNIFAPLIEEMIKKIENK